MASKIRNATIIVLLTMIRSDTRDIEPDTKIVTKKIVTTQRIVLLRSFFEAPGSDLDTCLIPFDCKNNGGKQDKSYGLGRVGFPRTEPAVAAQAVSI